ncbi:hypothetical protein Peur_024042 [Populus x canadensis]
MVNTKLLILFFLAIAMLNLSTPVQSSIASSLDLALLLATDSNTARPQIPSCSEMVSTSLSATRAHVLDDMCFSKAEA